jgi:hypothetical protein
LLPPIVGIVIYGSFQVSNFECTVCMEFEGRETCRTVTGLSREEGLQSAVNNACAILAAGMTDTIRCSRQPPKRAECVPIVGGERPRPTLGPA